MDVIYGNENMPDDIAAKTLEDQKAETGKQFLAQKLAGNVTMTFGADVGPLECLIAYAKKLEDELPGHGRVSQLVADNDRLHADNDLLRYDLEDTERRVKESDEKRLLAINEAERSRAEVGRLTSALEGLRDTIKNLEKERDGFEKLHEIASAALVGMASLTCQNGDLRAKLKEHDANSY